MTSFAFGLVGAAAMPFAPALGYTLFSGLGSALFGKLPGVKQEGPRLDDLAVQSSAYGGSVVWHAGTVRMSGNIIWAPPLDEVVHKDKKKVGGKGSPSQTVTTKTYQYYATFILALCEGEIAGIRRMWINGELVLDRGVQANLADVVLSSEKWKGKLRVYPGSETQIVDSVVEDHEGVGESSAYRGLAYVLFDRLDVSVTKTIPLVEVEVVKHGSSGPEFSTHVFADGMTAPLYTSDCDVTYCEATKEFWVVDVRYNYPWTSETPCRIAIFDMASSQWTGYVDFPSSTPAPHGAPGTSRRTWYHKPWGVYQVSARGNDMDHNSILYDVATRSLIGEYNNNDNLLAIFPYGACPVAFDYERNRCIFADGYIYSVWQLDESHLPQVELSRDFVDNTYYSIGPAVCDNNGDFWVFTNAWLDDGSPNPERKGIHHFVRTGNYVRIAHVQMDTDGWEWTGEADIGEIAYDTSRHCIYYWSADATKLKRLDCDSNVITTVGTYVADTGEPGGNRIEYDGSIDRLVVLKSAGGLTGGVWFIDPSDGSVETEYAIADSGGGRFLSRHWAYISGAGIWAAGGASTGHIDQLLFDTIVSAPPSLASVFTELSAKVKLGPSRLNVTAADAIPVSGYSVIDVDSGRSAIEPLMRRFNFDVVDSDGKVKIVLRGGSIAYVLSDLEMGAVDGGSAPVPKLTNTRGQELELPREYRVKYPDIDSNYMSGVQYERMLGGSTIEIAKEESMIVMTGSEARQMAAKQLLGAHANRHSLQFSTPIKLAWLEPTDLVQYRRGNILYTAQLREFRLSSLVINWGAVTEDPSVYTQSGVGATVAYSTAGLQDRGPTRLFILDLPLLRQVDDATIGPYAIAVGTANNWIGAELYRAIDGVNYSPMGVTFYPGGSLGFAGNPIGGYPGGNTLDMVSRLTVTLAPGSATLSNAASFFALLTGVNHGAYGKEIIAWLYAELVAVNTYVLSGLLRGRAGTEEYTGTHTGGEQFAVLTADSVEKLELAQGDIGVTSQFKAVTFGSTLEDTGVVLSTFENNSHKCLAPVRLRGSRNAATNDVIITANRRARYGNGWTAYVDLPLGEAIEAYDIEIWDSAFTTLKRTFADLSELSVTYTGAMQTTDFGSPQATVYVRAYQKNSYGRGKVLQGSVK